MKTHRFDHFEHAAGARIAARCRCGWRTEFMLDAGLAGSLLDEHLTVAQEMTGADADDHERH